MFLQLSCWLRFTFCFCPWILRLLWLFCFFNVWLLCAFVVSGSCGSCGLVYLYHADWFAVSSLSIIVSIVYFGRHVLFAEKKHTTYTSNTFGPWCQKCQWWWWSSCWWWRTSSMIIIAMVVMILIMSVMMVRWWWWWWWWWWRQWKWLSYWWLLWRSKTTGGKPNSNATRRTREAKATWTPSATTATTTTAAATPTLARFSSLFNRMSVLILGSSHFLDFSLVMFLQQGLCILGSQSVVSCC